MKKSDKSAISRELINLKLLKESCHVLRNTEMVVIDFMGLMRKIPMKTLRLQTYGDLAENIKYTIVSHLSYASRVDIIFDVYYKKNSIKDAVRSACRYVGKIPISIKKTSKSYQCSGFTDVLELYGQQNTNSKVLHELDDKKFQVRQRHLLWWY